MFTEFKTTKELIEFVLKGIQDDSIEVLNFRLETRAELFEMVTLKPHITYALIMDLRPSLKKEMITHV